MENNSMEKILLVDDEPDILEFLRYNLVKENYQVLTAKNGRDAINKAQKEMPHLILLDVMMPELDGIETCRVLRQIPELDNTIIVFLTARSEDYSQIAGFEAGADDYITKPVKPRVLSSKIKALFRRVAVSDEIPNTIQAGNLIIDKEKYLVSKEGADIVLPKKEFELLVLLASKPNRVFTREEIYAAIWGNQVIVGDRTIDVHIRKLREKIGESYIKTTKGVGYKFEIK
ncbi:MAG: response regulator transcription factor [Bacteroidetes bacterium]|nr:response regulator transcription factor [Bacteroidota bacterium]MBU1717913.1 response regulator transcription factor [Bacteroidota bacterium]